MRNHANRLKIDAMLATLCAQFPAAFFIDQTKRRPLKVGVYADLDATLDTGFDRKILKLCLRAYVGNIDYVRKLANKGARRIDLGGNPAGPVSDEDAETARRNVALFDAKRAERNRQIKAIRQAERLPAKTAPPLPRKKDGLSALREAAARRKTAQTTQESA